MGSWYGTEYKLRLSSSIRRSDLTYKDEEKQGNMDL